MNQPNQSIPRPPIGPRHQRQTGGLSMWRLWATHYRKASPEPTTKLQRLRLRRAIKKDWDALVKRFPDNDDLHTYLDGDERLEYPRGYDQPRKDLCDAIDRANISERRSNDALAAHEAVERNRQSTRRNLTNSHERLLRARIRLLQDIRALVGFERSIGALADVLRAHDAGVRTTEARANVDDTSNQVAYWRREELKPLTPLQRRVELDARRNMGASFNQKPGSEFVPLGGGNNDTQLGVWIRTDVHRNIIERTVIKDVCYDHDPFEWNNALVWHNVDDPIGKVLTEAHIMERLRDTQDVGVENVVKLRWRQLRAAELTFRMYLEYCPYGDLRDVLRRHVASSVSVPEPLIWHIFESLVNAGLLMEQGGVTQPRNPWMEIVHLDFKPPNVLLGLYPQPAGGLGHWAAYPTIKLGDYGLAAEISPGDPENPGLYTDSGTDRYHAPEQVSDIHGEDPPRMTAKTNVFGVGVTIMLMMDRLNEVGVDDNWALGRASRIVQWKPEVAADYSEELKDLVLDCVEYEQMNRPSFAEIRDIILHHTQGEGGLPQHDLAMGMRAATAPQLAQLGLLPDRFAPGLDFGQIVIPTVALSPVNFESDGAASEDDE